MVAHEQAEIRNWAFCNEASDWSDLISQHWSGRCNLGPECKYQGLSSLVKAGNRALIGQLQQPETLS
jgi:hypothetical protein